MSNIFDPYATGSATAPNAAGSGGGTGTPITTGLGSTQIAPPGAAVSPYQFQTYVASANVVLGPEIAALLGLSPDAPHTGLEIMHAYYDMPHADLITLNSLLNKGGFYESAAGTPITTGLDFGAYNNDNFNALGNAILATANSQQTMSTQVSQQIASGAGYLQQRGATAPVTGGGNTYKIDLTNPKDVYAAVYQTFEQYLGRAPTSAEVNDVIGKVQSQETSYQQAINQQQEQMSQSTYQEKLNQRTAMQTPQVANGPISDGPFTTPADAAVAVLQALGDPSLVTQSNVEMVSAWIQANGGLNDQTHNLLGVNAAPNSQGGQGFGSYSEGIQAAVNLLNSPKFSNLLAAIQSGDASGQLASNKKARQELTTWSGGSITSLDTGTQSQAAATAIQRNAAATATQPPAAGTTELTRAQAPNFMGPLPATGAGAPPPPDVTRSQDPNFMGPLPSVSTAPQTTDVSQIGAGQGVSSPADSYQPSTTITNIAAPSPSSVATYEATQGANRPQYLGNQYLQAYQAVVDMIHSLQGHQV